VQVVVHHRREQRMRARDGVEIPGEVEVDVLHRHHLRVSAAGGAALHAEHRAEARLADAEHRLLAEPSERLRHAHGDGALSLSGGRGIDPGHEHEPSADGPRSRLEGDLCFVLAVKVQVVDSEPELGGHVGDGARLRALGDLDVARY
jgi:hypothetical protein